jgi:isocitrate dehydrogenase kinase/phosphatase
MRVGRESTLNLAGSTAEGNRDVGEAAAGVAEAIGSAWERYLAGYEEITRRARQRFERRDWAGSQSDAAERLTLYRVHLDAAVADVRDILGDAVMERTLWTAVKTAHERRAAGRPDGELVRTFFNSVTRRIFSTVGVDDSIEYLDSAAPVADAAALEALVTRVPAGRLDGDLVRRILRSYAWSVPYAQLTRDADLVARLLLETIGPVPDGDTRTIEMLRPVFFRNKGAYLVGRIRDGQSLRPLVLPLIHAERGIVVDAVLTTENEASVVFGFSWSYFRVEVSHPRAMVDFLRSIMPYKRIDELYTAIGFSKHGKTELFRSLMRHLEEPEARFAFAEGDEGMVMAVFTLPAFNVVFKIIKDSFGAPKNTTRAAVMEKYHFVFVRDRVGRLADAQEFEHLDFPRRCFPEALLSYLLTVAAATVRVEGERVVVRHLYTERRVVPLNLYLRDAEPEAARDAVIDYGTAIKDLAAADIFTGDMLLKNFGVTRNGRVICYDYDELCLLSDCSFRRIPQPATIEEEFAAEPWFHVGELDIFPEEFQAFLVPPGPVRDTFLAAHGDLLDVEFWQGVQRRLAGGEVVDVYPYRRSALLRREAEV